MPVQIVIRDSGDFRRFASLASRVASSGSGGLKQQAAKSVSTSTRGLAREMSNSALGILPRRGGLASRVSKSRYSTKARNTRREARVVFEATNAYNIIAIDRGRVRHPVFGNRSNWVDQIVRQGWFTRVTDRQEGPVRRALVGAMVSIKRRFDRL